MFRFREVEKKFDSEYDFDKRINSNQKEEGYKQIKPETNMTYEEAVAYLIDIFDQRI